MLENAPDRPDFDEYEAEHDRAHRHMKRLDSLYEREEINAEEKEIEKNGRN